MIRALILLAAFALASSGAGLEAVDEAGYRKVVASHRGKVVVVNFWATWCAPCRKEMPDLAAIQARQAQRGVVLVTVSADEPEDAQRAEAFLRQSKVAGPAYLKRAKDDDAFINAIDPKWSGALPATFLYDREGRKVRSFFGEVDPKQLEAAVSALR